MSLNGDTLGALIVAKLSALGASPTQTQICNAIGEAIVSHFTGNAVVQVTSVSGVTTGSGTSGSGTGTLS